MPLSASLLRRSASPRSRRSRRPTAPQRRSGKAVQATCDATAAKPASEVGQRIARAAINEFTRFGGHKVDSTGRLFHFGLTEAEHEEDDGGDRAASVGRLGWWQVMKYWRALFGNDTADSLEVIGYRDASTIDQGNSEPSTSLRTRRCRLLRAAEAVSDPAIREVLREAALRAAIIDTPWSAAFISYVVRQAGAGPNAFKFANAHRIYIYDAFAASTAELTNEGGDQIYRACPLATTKPRAGDMVCQQREPSLADASEELGARAHPLGAAAAAPPALRPAHPLRRGRVDRCEGAQGVRHRRQRESGRHRQEAEPAARPEVFGRAKGPLRRPGPLDAAPGLGPSRPRPAPEKCSLNDKKWFVLLQVR